MIGINSVIIGIKQAANKYAIRCLASRPTRRNNRKSASEDYEEDSPLEDIQDADYVDLRTLEQSSKQLYRKVEQVREKERYLIVKDKYFKTHTPNFLSWNEKMKIRSLYNGNEQQDGWSVERLSESFPALPDTICKIVKSNWVKSNMKQIEQHDEKVEQTWEAFQQGNLDLPDDLLEHLKKFTVREKNVVHESDERINVTVPKRKVKPNGFEAIISSYEEINEKNKVMIAAEHGIEPKQLESALISKNEEESIIAIDTKEAFKGRTKSKKEKKPLYIVPGIDL